MVLRATVLIGRVMRHGVYRRRIDEKGHGPGSPDGDAHDRRYCIAVVTGGFRFLGYVVAGHLYTAAAASAMQAAAIFLILLGDDIDDR